MVDDDLVGAGSYAVQAYDLVNDGWLTSQNLVVDGGEPLLMADGGQWEVNKTAKRHKRMKAELMKNSGIQLDETKTRIGVRHFNSLVSGTV